MRYLSIPTAVAILAMVLACDQSSDTMDEEPQSFSEAAGQLEEDVASDVEGATSESREDIARAADEAFADLEEAGDEAAEEVDEATE
jgi:hypothetical protein